jgi:hypothetical protein
MACLINLSQETTRMIRIPLTLSLAAIALALAACSSAPPAPKAPMSFFVTSANPGKGGDLGGLEGADKYCQQLAAAAGAGGKTWKAYLSSHPRHGGQIVNARVRIGNGPWYNAQGVRVAASVDDLHGPNNNLNKQTALTEKGEVVSGRGDPVNLHDILTGSTAEGRVDLAAAGDTTCGNWTSSNAGAATVGHHDRIGLNDSAPMKSWNASHPTRNCTMDGFKATGGGGRFYCFASN